MSGFISKGKEKFHRLEDKFGKLPGRDRLVESGKGPYFNYVNTKGYLVGQQI